MVISVTTGTISNRGRSWNTYYYAKGSEKMMIVCTLCNLNLFYLAFLMQLFFDGEELKDAQSVDQAISQVTPKNSSTSYVKNSFLILKIVFTTGLCRAKCR